jgi:hypothetical protein
MKFRVGKTKANLGVNLHEQQRRNPTLTREKIKKKEQLQHRIEECEGKESKLTGAQNYTK